MIPVLVTLCVRWEHPDGGSAAGKCDVYITELVLVGRIEGGLERSASGFPPVDVEGLYSLNMTQLKLSPGFFS